MARLSVPPSARVPLVSVNGASIYMNPEWARYFENLTRQVTETAEAMGHSEVSGAAAFLLADQGGGGDVELIPGPRGLPGQQGPSGLPFFLLQNEPEAPDWLPGPKGDQTIGPAFSASQSTLQSVAASTFTKVQFQTEDFDTASAFDNATNYRFTPLVAGYYQFTWGVGFASIVPNLTSAIYKNGVRHKDASNIASGIVVVGSALIFMNGSSDYVEVFASQGSGGAINTSAAANQTYFQGAFLRP